MEGRVRPPPETCRYRRAGRFEGQAIHQLHGAGRVGSGGVMEELAGNPTASAEAPSARAGKFFFGALLGRILGGERLRAGESELLLEEILDGGGDPIVVGAILVAVLTAALVAWGPVRVRPLEVLRYE